MILRWLNEDTQVASGNPPFKRAIMITDVQFTLNTDPSDNWQTVVYVEVGA